MRKPPPSKVPQSTHYNGYGLATLDHRSKFKPNALAPKQEKKNSQRKKSIFNLIFHHHSRPDSRTTRCVYYFPKRFISSFLHTYTQTALFFRVYSLDLSPQHTHTNSAVCSPERPDVRVTPPCSVYLLESPSIHGGGARVPPAKTHTHRYTHARTHRFEGDFLHAIIIRRQSSVSPYFFPPGTGSGRLVSPKPGRAIFRRKTPPSTNQTRTS